MDNNRNLISCDSSRRFGVEIELNAFDFKNRPSGYEFGNLPEGIRYIANLVQKTAKNKVDIHRWQNNHHNDSWILKPDSSCGIEICTPVLKGMTGIKSVCSVVNSFSTDSFAQADSRCSFHVHVDVNDLKKDDLGAIISWWIKCESVFMDIVPAKRKRNKYCQMLSFTSIVENVKNEMHDSGYLINQLGKHKYFTLNTYHMVNRKRNTIEFRIMDSSCCISYFDAKNYILLILHFIKCSLERKLPCDYKDGDSFSGYSWLNLAEFLQFLHLDDDKNLSEGMKELRFWLYIRLQQNISNADRGIFGSECKSNLENTLHKLRSSNHNVFNCDFFHEKFQK